jgi:hypothetical protein
MRTLLTLCWECNAKVHPCKWTESLVQYHLRRCIQFLPPACYTIVPKPPRNAQALYATTPIAGGDIRPPAPPAFAPDPPCDLGALRLPAETSGEASPRSSAFNVCISAFPGVVGSPLAAFGCAMTRGEPPTTLRSIDASEAAAPAIGLVVWLSGPEDWLLLSSWSVSPSRDPRDRAELQSSSSSSTAPPPPCAITGSSGTALSTVFG